MTGGGAGPPQSRQTHHRQVISPAVKGVRGTAGVKAREESPSSKGQEAG